MTNENNAPQEAEEVPERLKESNPFDTPFVASALFFALAVWFGYDGWLNPETKSVMFNRIMFGVFVVVFAWTTRQDLVARRKHRETKSE